MLMLTSPTHAADKLVAQMLPTFTEKAGEEPERRLSADCELLLAERFSQVNEKPEKEEPTQAKHGRMSGVQERRGPQDERTCTLGTAVRGSVCCFFTLQVVRLFF